MVAAIFNTETLTVQRTRAENCIFSVIDPVIAAARKMHEVASLLFVVLALQSIV